MMPFRSRNIVREIVAAVAVMAIYFIVLLSPLHQSANLERDLNTLGFSSLSTFSVCVPQAQHDGDSPVEVAKCPVHGIGKHEIAFLAPSTFVVEIVRTAARVPFPPEVSPYEPRVLGEPGQARAPPVEV